MSYRIGLVGKPSVGKSTLFNAATMNDVPEGAYPFTTIDPAVGEAMVDYLLRFFEQRGVPDSMLSVGCGPAVLELEVAERYPETSLTCVDVAEAGLQALYDDVAPAAT